jgi:hypothetical protein
VVGATLALGCAVTALFLLGLVPMVALSAHQREAMAWVARNTPEDSTFLIVSGDQWALDRAGEWFPVLARRTSVATVQGSEWLGLDEFVRRIELHRRAERCGAQDPGCLQVLLDEGAAFTHVYLAGLRSPRCCAELSTGLRADPRYTLLYDSPSAEMFTRR